MRRIRASCQHLNELATQGPVAIYKRPSPLAFCANDQEDALPMRIQTEAFRNYQWGPAYRYREPWRLQYVQDNYQRNSMLQTFTAFDWSFIIGVMPSLLGREILNEFDLHYLPRSEKVYLERE